MFLYNLAFILLLHLQVCHPHVKVERFERRHLANSGDADGISNGHVIHNKNTRSNHVANVFTILDSNSKRYSHPGRSVALLGQDQVIAPTPPSQQPGYPASPTTQGPIPQTQKQDNTVPLAQQVPQAPQTVPEPKSPTAAVPHTQQVDSSKIDAEHKKETTQEQESDQSNDNGIQNSLRCRWLWFFFPDCQVSATKTTDEAPVTTTDQGTPVASPKCILYGSNTLQLSDFKDPGEDWIIVNEADSQRITHSTQVETDKPAVLQLNDNLCNAATYEATVKLGVDSSGGVTFRGSEQHYIAFEMNSVSKTATLKKVSGTNQEILTDVACLQVNSQFVTKVEIRDTGYKGQVEVLLNGQKIMNVNTIPFDSSGYFGLFISMGNATFGDISIIPAQNQVQ